MNIEKPDNSWKTRTYIIGGVVGALFGLASAYLFSRTAEENSEDSKPEKIPTGTLIGLTLSAISLLRQIAESGKPRKK